MPNHKSAEKRDRQNERRKAVNIASRTRLRSQIKRLSLLLAKGQADEAIALLPATISVIDKSVQKGVLHQNTAARHKARLTMRVNELQAK